MGTREVYEEKLKRGNLQFDPTIKPGLGSARCPRCLSLLNSDSVCKNCVIHIAYYMFDKIPSWKFEMFVFNLDAEKWRMGDYSCSA